jgi:hypothetical protein
LPYDKDSNAVRGVEIFAPGTHNGDPYVEQDLDDIVSAFSKLDFRPALKIGHTKDTPGAPAYGWVTNLRKAGGKLVADFESMHDTVVQALRDKRYDRVSSEIYFNLKRGDNTFRRALKAVALLGADVPAVAGLTPLHKMEFAESGFDSLAACEQELEIAKDAIIASLNERVAAMDVLLTEKDQDMKTIKELKDAKAALEAQIAAFSTKGDKMTDEEKAAMTKCQDDMKAFGEQITQLEKAETDAKELAELRAARTTAEAARKADQERIAALEAKDRAREVSDRLSKCTVPAFRPAAEALYNYALANQETKVKYFAAPDKDGKRAESEKTLPELVDGMIETINANAKHLFSVVSKGTDGKRPEGTSLEDAGLEIDRLAQQRIRDKKSKDYDEAMDAVCAEHPELAKAYAEQQGHAAAS